MDRPNPDQIFMVRDELWQSVYDIYQKLVLDGVEPSTALCEMVTALVSLSHFMVIKNLQMDDDIWRELCERIVTIHNKEEFDDGEAAARI